MNDADFPARDGESARVDTANDDCVIQEAVDQHVLSDARDAKRAMPDRRVGAAKRNVRRPRASIPDRSAFLRSELERQEATVMLFDDVENALRP
jgi:hypothetical protein